MGNRASPLHFNRRLSILGSTTTGLSEWDAEYLDSLDDDDYYDYGNEHDVNHDDVTVLDSDTTTLEFTTTPPSVTVQETTEGITNTTSSDDVSTPYYDDTKNHNTTQQNNSSMTQISPTPERAQSADITRNASNSNKT